MQSAASALIGNAIGANNATLTNRLFKIITYSSTVTFLIMMATLLALRVTLLEWMVPNEEELVALT